MEPYMLSLQICNPIFTNHWDAQVLCDAPFSHQPSRPLSLQAKCLASLTLPSGPQPADLLIYLDSVSAVVHYSNRVVQLVDSTQCHDP
eukprot:3891485-Amphidinium_carterae.1